MPAILEKHALVQSLIPCQFVFSCKVERVLVIISLLILSTNCCGHYLEIVSTLF